MRVSLSLTSLAGLACLCALGCGSKPYDGGAGLEAPANSTAAYPVGPYGTRTGDTIADATFLGYPRFDDRSLQPVSFHDFYDPDGSKGIKLIDFSAGAIWCPPCNEEAAALSDTANGAQALRDELGVAFVQNLTEGDNPASPLPANEDDLNQWLDSYSLPFPLFLDPSKKMSAYFDAKGIPFGMLIDPRTMKIVHTQDGWFGGTTAQQIAGLRDELSQYVVP